MAKTPPKPLEPNPKTSKPSGKPCGGSKGGKK